MIKYRFLIGVALIFGLAGELNAQNKTPSFGTTYKYFSPCEWEFPDHDEPVLDANLGPAGQHYDKLPSWVNRSKPGISASPASYAGACSIPNYKTFLSYPVAVKAVCSHGKNEFGTMIEDFLFESAPGATPAAKKKAAETAMKARVAYLKSHGFTAAQIIGVVHGTRACIYAKPAFYTSFTGTASEQVYVLAVCEQEPVAMALKAKGVLAAVYNCRVTTGAPFHRLYRGLNGKSPSGTIGFRNIAANLKPELNIQSGDTSHPVGLVTLSPAVKKVTPSRQGQECCGLWFTGGDFFTFELDTKCTLSSLSDVKLDSIHHTDGGEPGTVCHDEEELTAITTSASWDDFSGTKFTVTITGPLACDAIPTNDTLLPGWTGQYWIKVPWESIRANGNLSCLDGNTAPWYSKLPSDEECIWTLMNPYHSGEGRNQDDYVFDPYCGMYFGSGANAP